jgi:deoxyribodipyrimidine photo-lyase
MRRWLAAGRRHRERAPGRVVLPPGVAPGRAPARERLAPGKVSPRLPAGGLRAGDRLLERWIRTGAERYAERSDALDADGTSRLSPYLHLGCVSPLEAAERCAGTPGGDAFVRQLCWRDFHHQVLAANPGLPREDLNPRGDRWREDAEGLARWREGRTGVPIVDAGMRQLAEEGWMHNRARLVTASFLTKDLYVDWRAGAAHFWDLLVDGDLANNSGNWQWVAGTGSDTRPHRMFNPLRQAERFDPRGDYVRRYLPELAGVAGGAVHEPGNLPEDARRTLDYPAPVVDHGEAVRRFRAARAR